MPENLLDGCFELMCCHLALAREKEIQMPYGMGAFTYR